MRYAFRTLGFSCTALLATLVAAPAQAAPVRVGLLSGGLAPGSVVVTGEGFWQSRQSQRPFGGTLHIARRGDHIEISRPGQRPLQVGDWLKLTPRSQESLLTLGATSYRGSLEIEARRSRAGLWVTNSVELEAYLQGVVPNEMFTIPEASAALEVQAVVSRTLALFIQTVQPRHAAQGFDVCAAGHCQVYKGASSENARACQAVGSTRGKVLTYRGEFILAAYHANAGGYTTTTDEAWPGSARLPYLRPVGSPHDDFAYALHYGDCYRWVETVKPEDIRQRVRRLTGRDSGPVQEIVIANSNSGRIKQLTVVGEQGEVRIVGPHRIRVALGLTQEATGKSYDHDIRLVSVEGTPRGFVLTGYGAGEGVGLSQHGAIGMARAGFVYWEILGHYYRSTILTEDYGRGTSVPLRPPTAPRAAHSQQVKSPREG